MHPKLILSFLLDFSEYIISRLRQTTVLAYAVSTFIVEALSNLKVYLVRNMFWGRSSFYRSSFHILMSLVTLMALLTGVSSRLNIVNARDNGLDISSGIIGRQDIFLQSGTSETITALEDYEADYKTFKHEVEKGETLSSIAELYQLEIDSLRWANDLSSDSLNIGQILRIPEIDGTFWVAEPGDTLEKIAIETEGTVADILDLNSHLWAYEEDPKLEVGMEIFIPGGKNPKPTPTSAPIYIAPGVPAPPTDILVPAGTFIHPLLDPSCSGWSWSRGYGWWRGYYWHGGADMAKRGGCWVNAAGDGTVSTVACYGYGPGCHVVIDHGNGLQTKYFHGNGQFNVKVGDQVKKGQPIMYMGSTGNSTGTHLHFEVVLNGNRLNPENYVKLR